MDVKAKIEEIIKEIEKKPELLKNFKSKPVETVKSLLKVNVSDDVVEAIVTGVKAKLGSDDIKSKLGSIEGIFGKKN